MRYDALFKVTLFLKSAYSSTIQEWQTNILTYLHTLLVSGDAAKACSVETELSIEQLQCLKQNHSIQAA